MTGEREPAVWFLAIHTGTGTDISTQRLARGLRELGLRTEITWLPLRAEYAPWTVAVPQPPAWANVVYINTWLMSRFVPKELPVVAGLRHSVHDPALRPYKGAIRDAYHRFWIAPIERRNMCRASKVIAVSHFAADMARKMLVDVPIQVIYNGIDTNKFRPSGRQRNAGEPFRLLYVGSWMARKGVDLLAPIMRELGDRFELHYTGGSRADGDKSRMPNNMHDIGRLRSEDAVVAAMQEVDAFVFPTRSEGFGLVAAEAMACGLPVVCTRGSSLVEIVEDGTTGVLCQKDDIHDFVSAIRGLKQNPNRAGDFGRAARRRVKAVFHIDTMIAAYAEACRDCLTTSARCPGSGADSTTGTAAEVAE